MTDTKNLLTALLETQREVPTLKLGTNATNPAFKNKYVTLDKLMAEVLPLLNRHGLVWTTLPVDRPNGPVLNYRLIHAATGEVLEGEIPLMLDKQNSQGLGSAVTYSRRQSVMAVLGLAADPDDDGAKASVPRSEQPTTVKSGDRPLNDEELKAMRVAIKDSGLHEALVLSSVGVEDVVMLSHARAIRAKLDAGVSAK